MDEFASLQTPELVRKKVEQLFKLGEWPQVWAILNAFETSSSISEVRVHLAMLKLSGGTIERLQRWLLNANQDWRDVLAAAEYPSQLEFDSWKLPPGEMQALVEKDRQQYLAWLQDDAL